MIKSMQDIIKKAQEIEQKTLVVAVAQDEHVIEAVHMAVEARIIKPILIGDQKAITDIFELHNINPQYYEIIHEPDAVMACEKAVDKVRMDPQAFLMKGYVDTSIILKAALDKDKGLRSTNRLSHVSVMEIPTYHKLLLMTDGAMNINPDVNIKQEIIENAVGIAHALGVKHPSVGCIAAIEKVNLKMQATVDAKTLIERNQQGIIQGCVIGGPFAIDNAINKEAAIHKGITDPMAGDVDLLLMPQIESGNIFYKSMIFLGNAKGASIIAGATKPIVLTSRADSKESKFYSIALGALACDK
ncbi:MAG: bifunctional enoyl-CoA hydratase/phosphate acetyltransferase [Acholeplasmataceae bacterium]